MRPWVVQYAVGLTVFLVLDLLWLGVVADDLYADQLGDLMAEEPDVLAAAVFYLLFVAGLVFFVVHPAVEAGSIRRALLTGAFFGLVTYAAWDLTNLAVLRDFPAALVAIDLAWGSVLAGTTGAVTTAVVLRLGATGRSSRPRS